MTSTTEKIKPATVRLFLAAEEVPIAESGIQPNYSNLSVTDFSSGGYEESIKTPNWKGWIKLGCDWATFRDVLIRTVATFSDLNGKIGTPVRVVVPPESWIPYADIGLMGIFWVEGRLQWSGESPSKIDFESFGEERFFPSRLDPALLIGWEEAAANDPSAIAVYHDWCLDDDRWPQRAAELAAVLAERGGG